MNRSPRLAVWFGRLVLAAATFVMAAIAMRNLTNPVGAAALVGVAPQSPAAVTVLRVGFGGFPLGFAILLFACVIATRRLLTGLWVLLAVTGAVTASRIQGLIVDGPTPYNLRLLFPEVAMVTLSLVGIGLERRRRRHRAPVGHISNAEPPVSGRLEDRQGGVSV